MRRAGQGGQAEGPKEIWLRGVPLQGGPVVVSVGGVWGGEGSAELPSSLLSEKSTGEP